MSQQRSNEANGGSNINQLSLGLQMSGGVPNVLGGLTTSSGQIFGVNTSAASNMLSFQDLPPNSQVPHPLLVAQQQVAASRMHALNPDLGNFEMPNMTSSASHQMSMNNNVSTTSPDQRQQHSQGLVLPGNMQIKQEVCSSPPINTQSMLPPYNSSQLSHDKVHGLDTSGSLGVPMMGGGGIPKHICQVCGDKASGKHYGVYSCEGCKGFFKRTVRKDLTYNCRDNKDCVIDKRQRNRCQYCRYHKCLETGMKREAVQEERQKNKEKDDKANEVPNPNDEMPVDKILQAEVSSEPSITDIVDFSQSEQQDAVAHVCKVADRQLFTLVEWAKRVPHFNSLPIEDRVCLLQAGWNELLIASFSHRSTTVSDGILLATGLHVHRHSATAAGIGPIFERVLTELVTKMRDMKMDKTELGCLRAIVLYNPDVKALSDANQIEGLREKVYASLEAYCRSKYPDQPGRFAKLLLRLPALRSIGLKCMEHLFFFKLIGDTPIDKFLHDMLENSSTEGENSINNQLRLSTSSTVSSVS